MVRDWVGRQLFNNWRRYVAATRVCFPENKVIAFIRLFVSYMAHWDLTMYLEPTITFRAW